MPVQEIKRTNPDIEIRYGTSTVATLEIISPFEIPKKDFKNKKIQFLLGVLF